MQLRILTINAGSSTIKFAVFRPGPSMERLLTGRVQGLGQAEASLTAVDHATSEKHESRFPAAGHHGELIDWLARWSGPEPFQAIGHRVVHGGVALNRHLPITRALVRELCRAQPLDLAHLPTEIALIEAFLDHFPETPQFACFDTVFHQDLPRVAQLLPIPRRYFDAGIRRLGFHGLSYMYLARELRRIAGPAAGGRAILAHLGSGASMTALRDGAPLDTTMAFTPTGGLVMATRPGDLDPGLLVYLMRSENLTPDELDEFVSRQCGLAGIAESDPDMRVLAAQRAHDENARDAFDLFCYQAKKWIGAYTAVLGGLDTLVFSGGIGENSPEARASICEGLEYLGVRLDAALNAAGNAGVVSAGGCSVVVRVIPTDEERMIAEIVRDLTT